MAGWFSIFLGINYILISSLAIIGIIFVAVSIFNPSIANAFERSIPDFNIPENLGTFYSIYFCGSEVYVLLTLKEFLNKQAKIFDANIYISFLIGISIIFTILEMVPPPSGVTISMIGIITNGLFAILMMIFFIVIGVKLLKCEDNVFGYGYLKPYAYCLIFGGILAIFGIGIFIIGISYILLGNIFFKTSTLSTVIQS